jgi:hypothetical protein
VGDEELAGRLRAKRLNEHVKLFANTLNAIGLVTFGAGVLQPLLAQSATATVNWPWVAISAILHLWAQASLRLLRLE